MEHRVSRITLAAAFALAAGWALSHGGADEKPVEKTMLRHVVMFKFREGTKPETAKEIEAGFRALPGKIKEIVDFEWGTNVSIENLSDGFTHCFLVTFKDEKGRGVYLPHPDHLKFVDLIKPHLEKVVVVDYVPAK